MRDLLGRLQLRGIARYAAVCARVPQRMRKTVAGAPCTCLAE